MKYNDEISISKLFELIHYDLKNAPVNVQYSFKSTSVFKKQ